MQRSSFFATFVTLLLVMIGGCNNAPSRDASVSGTVLIDGQLAQGGTITFHSVAGGPPAVGRILSDGSYTVRTGRGNLADVDRGTLKSGEYKVTVAVYGDVGDPIGKDGPPKAGPRLTAAKYSSVATTDLERKVKPGDNLFIFELAGVGMAEPMGEESETESSQTDEPEDKQADSELAEANAESSTPEVDGAIDEASESESAEAKAEPSAPEATEAEPESSEPEANEAKAESIKPESAEATDETSQPESTDVKDESTAAPPTEESADESTASSKKEEQS